MPDRVSHRESLRKQLTRELAFRFGAHGGYQAHTSRTSPMSTFSSTLGLRGLGLLSLRFRSKSITRGAKRACDTEGNISASVLSAFGPLPAHIWRKDAVIVHPQRVLLRQLTRTAHEKVVQAEGNVALEKS